MVGHRWAVAAAGLGIVGLVSLGPAEAARDVPSCPSPPANPTTTGALRAGAAPTAVDPVVPAPGSGTGDASASPTITVSVRPGPLTLVTRRAVIELRSAGEQLLCGRLPPVRVIDARGGGDGWRVRWSVESITAGGRRLPRFGVGLVPDPPVVVYGLPTGLVAGGTSGADRRVLVRAEPDTGGGTYEAGASVEARLGRGRGRDAGAPDTALLVLGFTLVPRG